MLEPAKEKPLVTLPSPWRSQVRAFVTTNALAGVIGAFVWSVSVAIGGTYALERPLIPLEAELDAFKEELDASDSLNARLDTLLTSVNQRAARYHELTVPRSHPAALDSLATLALWDSVTFGALGGLPLSRPDERVFTQTLAMLGEERRGFLAARRSTPRGTGNSLAVLGIASVVALRNAFNISRQQARTRKARFERLITRINGESAAILRKVRTARLVFPLSWVALNLLVWYAFIGPWIAGLRAREQPQPPDAA